MRRYCAVRCFRPLLGVFSCVSKILLPEGVVDLAALGERVRRVVAAAHSASQLCFSEDGNTGVVWAQQVSSLQTFSPWACQETTPSRSKAALNAVETRVVWCGHWRPSRSWAQHALLGLSFFQSVPSFLSCSSLLFYSPLVHFARPAFPTFSRWSSRSSRDLGADRAGRPFLLPYPLCCW